ncbi:PIR Superfamily Protein [Plasmodium ovale wallikeri]|uniref:PIR Superfamily Protein n=2 Tax=Plasmodium ovale TaxID=36330 RepID=A0A1A9AQ76_PLAOA|nr:PIR Superfamily Protein [Plasmodium ovale wallikeri]SBT58338.1 PIR Superfamily Protein [Plasmodium ovale wallikeri]SBT72767.1 PIR protein [Plasmodium ovale]
MDCDTLTIADSYGFFKNFDNYKNLLEDFKKHSNRKNITEGCSSFLDDSILSQIPSTEEICKQFKYLYNKLSNRNKSGVNTANLDSNDYNFMNYWLNSALKGNNIESSTYISQLYGKLKTDTKFFTKEFSPSRFSNIGYHYLENVKKLIELYNYKDEISGIFSKLDSGEGDRILCLNYTRKCNDKYRMAIINCIDECQDFYEALELFQCKYNQEIIQHAISEYEYNSTEMVKLQDKKSVLEDYETKKFTRNITISILLPILGLLFMLFFSNMVKGTYYTNLTPFRQVLLEKIMKMRNIWNSDSEPKNLLTHSFDGEYINSDDVEYNIGYFSTRNT